MNIQVWGLYISNTWRGNQTWFHDNQHFNRILRRKILPQVFAKCLISFLSWLVSIPHPQAIYIMSPFSSFPPEILERGVAESSLSLQSTVPSFLDSRYTWEQLTPWVVVMLHPILGCISWGCPPKLARVHERAPFLFTLELPWYWESRL